MSESLSLFLIAAINDEYRTFSVGGLRPDDAVLAKIEKDLNSNPVDTPIKQVVTLNGRTSHPETVEFWALKINRPTGGRPGRQLTLAIRHDASISSAQINILIDELDGITGLATNFYSTNRDSEGAQEWLKMLASNIQFSLKTAKNEVDGSNRFNAKANHRTDEPPLTESYGNPWVDSNAQSQQATLPNTREKKKDATRPSSPDINAINTVSNSAATANPSKHRQGISILLQLIILILLVVIIVQNKIIIQQHSSEPLIINDQNYGALDHNIKIKIAGSKVYVNGDLREPVKATSNPVTKEDLQREVSELRQQNDSLKQEVQRLNQQLIPTYINPFNDNINRGNNSQNTKIDGNQ